MKDRIIGFDLARSYAIFGMFIVNFNFSFGNVLPTEEPIGRFLNLFTGNSTSIFIILAGMGVSLMTRKSEYSIEEKAKCKSIILKRSWFLFFAGLLLFTWWSGDILHFYGGYMHIAALILFVPKRYFLWIALLVIVIYHLLLLIIPVETSWDFQSYKYADFWTPIGFLRNTLYNGWNSMFPWFSFFAIGMWLGKLDWHNKLIRKNVFITGLMLFTTIQIIRFLAKSFFEDDFLHTYILSEYFPPYLPFLLVTAGFALMVISICMYLGEKFKDAKFVQCLAKTGQMTLSHYIIHITVGMLILEELTKKTYTGFAEDETPTLSIYILLYAISFFVLSIIFSWFWSKKFKNGPLETVMRKISG
jgi:uncharacterized membrane protein YeiB